MGSTELKLRRERKESGRWREWMEYAGGWARKKDRAESACGESEQGEGGPW